MRQRIISILLALTVLLSLSSCTGKSNSTFSIEFIDVGQGDAALVECDGKRMLIDGGDKSAGDKIYKMLENEGIQHLDILAISHLHADHIGGLAKVLTYVSSIDLTLANSDYSETDTFKEFEGELRTNKSEIKIPQVGEKFPLGSATVEVVDTRAEKNNDSLVLLITYGKTRFLFTGDIEENMQSRIANKYNTPNIGEKNYPKKVPCKIDVMKMPHHGSSVSYPFMWTFMPSYAIISVDQKNHPKHPKSETINMLEEMKTKPERKNRLQEYYRTDLNGNITVKSNGKKVTITTSK